MCLPGYAPTGTHLSLARAKLLAQSYGVPDNASLYHHPSSHSCDPGSSSHRADSDGEGEGHVHKRRISCAYPAERAEPDQSALRARSERCGPLHSVGRMVETQQCVLATDTG